MLRGDGFAKKVTQIAAITTGGKRFYNRGDVPQFLIWLKRQPETHVYSLNIQYDLGNLFADDLEQLDQTLVGGRVIKAKWEGTGKSFLDVFNIWPMSVKKLGEAFGLKKLETKSMAHDKKYAFRDVEIIFKAMSFAWELAESFSIAKCPSTLGGLCVKVWKEMSGENCHDSNPISKDAYYGGRVELFKVRNDCAEIAYTDINSLYPAMMRGAFPMDLQSWTGDELPPFGVAKVRVKVPKCDLAVLPYRSEDGRILYPYGEFNGTWVIPELKAAIKRGAEIVDTIEVWGTEESFNPYNTFVEKLYQMRLGSKSEPEKLFFKLLMNNLYGRLGTSGIIGRTVWQDERNVNDGVCFGGKVLVQYQMPLSEETNWCHAAYVTAYGRLRLLEFIERIGVANMIYCDTDSTIFDCAGKKLPFECSSDLGEMKLESWETLCETYAPKMYLRQNIHKPNETDSKGNKLRDEKGRDYKAKGVPKKHARQFIEDGRVDFDLPFKMREAIRFYDRNNSRKLSVWRNVEKFNRGKYDKKKLKHNRYFPCKLIE